MTGDNRRRVSTTALSVALAVLLLALHARHLNFIVDDTFIPLRYAANFLEGHGLVFNHGEPVEGYTDFLWVLLAAIPLRLPIDPASSLQALAFLAGASLLALLPALYGGAFPGSRRYGYVLPPLLACSTPYALWSSAGMETSLFSLFITAGVLLSLSGERVLPLASASLLGACLTRPEGHLYAGLALIFVLAGRRREGKPLATGSLALALAGVLGILALYHGWRLWYYGNILPNTFAAKVGATGNQLARGLRYAGGFFVEGGGPILLLPVLPLLRRRVDARHLLLLACLVATLVYVIVVGGDSMLAYRFIVPVLPLWYILIVEAVAGASPGTGRTVSPALLVICTAAALGIWSFRAADKGLMKEVRRRSAAVRTWVEVGRWMKANLDGETHIALGAVGAIPFTTGFRTTDLFGLTDPVIARTPSEVMGRGLAGHERSNVARVLERRPDLILSYVVLTDQPLDRDRLKWLFKGSHAERELWDSPEVHLSYAPRSFDLGPGYLNVLARREATGPGP